MYKNLVMYYFSGTGNALTAAEWIAEHASGMGIDAEIVSIDRFRDINANGGREKLTGFCFPTHGFNIPWIMLKFILKFPFRKGRDVFLLNTRAGAKIGKYFTPGISGIALILPALILFIKGYRIRGLFSLDMPSNWISVHPGFKPETALDIAERCRKTISKFNNKVLNGKLYFRPNVFIMLPVDLALAPVAFGYFMYGRFLFAKIFIASYECDTCRLCAEKCPTEAIAIKNGRPYWNFNCESCMRCINICPKGAIQVSHSLAVLIVFAMSFLPLVILLEYAGPYVPNALKGISDFLISWGFTLAGYFILSGVVFILLKNKVINKFFTFTSLTKYWRRYIAPGVSAGKFRVKGK